MNIENEVTVRKIMSNYLVLSEQNIIEKSMPLLWLEETTNWEEEQFALLDCYLSAINSRDKSTGIVSFPKSDYEEYRCVKRIRTDELDKRLQKMFTPIKIPSLEDPEEFKLKVLFNECGVQKKR